MQVLPHVVTLKTLHIGIPEFTHRVCMELPPLTGNADELVVVLSHNFSLITDMPRRTNTIKAIVL